MMQMPEEEKKRMKSKGARQTTLAEALRSAPAGRSKTSAGEAKVTIGEMSEIVGQQLKKDISDQKATMISGIGATDQGGRLDDAQRKFGLLEAIGKTEQNATDLILGGAGKDLPRWRRSTRATPLTG